MSLRGHSLPQIRNLNTLEQQLLFISKQCSFHFLGVNLYGRAIYNTLVLLSSSHFRDYSTLALRILRFYFKDWVFRTVRLLLYVLFGYT